VVVGAWHGGQGGRLNTIRLDSDEYVIAIAGRAGERVDSLRIITNKRTSATFGGRGGSREFRFDVPSGYSFTGFVGRAGNALDAIGLAYASSSTYRPAQRIIWPRRPTS
jgi:hypothetical protein